jgi:hypothetical protein
MPEFPDDDAALLQYLLADISALKGLLSVSGTSERAGQKDSRREDTPSDLNSEGSEKSQDEDGDDEDCSMYSMDEEDEEEREEDLDEDVDVEDILTSAFGNHVVRGLASGCLLLCSICHSE